MMMIKMIAMMMMTMIIAMMMVITMTMIQVKVNTVIVNHLCESNFHLKKWTSSMTENL